MIYRTEFDHAAQRTTAWNLRHKHVDHTDKRYVTPASMRKVEACLQKAMGHLQAETVAVQCFAFSEFLREPLEEALGVPLTYTLGFVKMNNKPVFHTPIDELKRMLDAGRPASRALNLHAWLTLPSKEIIDVTFATTYAIVKNVPDLIGRASFIHPDDMVGNDTYHPQLLGEDFLRRIGMLLEF
ncbi:hypothetical protein [Collimonas humicola]|uniref:hypothetical protein n=1 Tax=Collimonas humicola TaxID=2825886 RepID=UPI001B8C373C|nr:hypothetical protein [Collimonas humicola]